MEYLDELKKYFGERYTDEEDILKLYSRDYWPLSLMKEYKGIEIKIPKAVVWPLNSSEVSYIMKLAKKYRFKIIPYGGGSGVCGAILDGDSIVIDMRKMNKILSIDEDSLTITVETGIYIKELEEYLNKRGYTLRHIPQSYPEAVLGGLISTFSIGQYSTKYGGIEDMVLNLEIASPNGDITWLRKNTVPRSAVGPDLKNLYIGSEGQFGIITKAVLKIRPYPKYIWKASYAYENFIDANYIVKELVINGIRPSVIRIYDEDDSRIRFNIGKNLILIMIEENNEKIFNTFVEVTEEVMNKAGARYIGEEFIDRWLKNRFDTINEIYRYLLPLGLWYDTIETSVLWSKLSRLYTTFKENIGKLNDVYGVLAHSSHFYLNGLCIYFTIVFKNDIKLYWRIWDEASKIILENGGTLSHHHGVGRLREKYIKDELKYSYNILKRIKNAIDPENIMGSGGWL